MGYVDPIRFLSPRLQRYAERARAAGPFIPPKPKVPSDFALAGPEDGVGPARAQSVREITAIVSRASGVSVTAIIGERRFAPFIKARHLLFWLADRETGMALTRLGRMFGGRDHTTIRTAVIKVDRVIAALRLTVPEDVGAAADLLWRAEWPNVATRRP